MPVAFPFAPRTRIAPRLVQRTAAFARRRVRSSIDAAAAGRPKLVSV